MSNKRFIIVFLAGILFFSALLFLNDVVSGDVATVVTRATLSTFEPESINRIEVRWAAGGVMKMAVSENGVWSLEEPFVAETDEEKVKRLVDAITLTPPKDMISDSDVTGMGRKISDFGFNPARNEIVLHSQGNSARIFIGDFTASGKEVYARVEGVKNIFVMPAETVDAVPVSSDGFRRRDLIGGTRDDISEIEFRAPGVPFVKVARSGMKWQLQQPFSASADPEAIRMLTDSLIAARVREFVLPSSGRPLAGEDVDAEGRLRVPGLVPFALDGDGNVSVTVRTKKGKTEQVVFGNNASSNFVYALVHGGTAVVKVPGELERICRVSADSLRDMRIFPILGVNVDSVSITFDSVVYVLRRAKSGEWRLESPVGALADQKTAAALVDSILRLKQNDITDDGDKKVQVTVMSSSTNFPPVNVFVSRLQGVSQPANLRSRILLEIEPGTTVRIETDNGAFHEMVELDSAKGVWMRKTDGDSGAGKVRRVKENAIRDITALLKSLKAEGIEALASTPADFERCGLKDPFYVLSVNTSRPEAARRNLILGSVTPSGGRYATLGGVDTIFILSRKDVMILTESLTE